MDLRVHQVQDAAVKRPVRRRTEVGLKRSASSEREHCFDVLYRSHLRPFEEDMYFGAAVIESGLASFGASESVSSSA